MTKPTAALVVSLMLACPALAGDDPLAEVARLLTGTVSSRAQSVANKDYRDVQLSIARAWPERTDGIWLYVEQALASSLDKPYRQRVYHLVAGPDGTVVSELWQLPGDPLKFAGEHAKPQPLAGLTPAELTRMEGCEVRLHRTGPARWEGATPERACKSTREGAAWTTSLVTLTEAGVDSWDRGWNTAGEQVWGAKAGPYHFRR